MGAKVEGASSKNCLPYTERGCPTASSANLSKSDRTVMVLTVLVDSGTAALASSLIFVLPVSEFFDPVAACPRFTVGAVWEDCDEVPSSREVGDNWVEAPVPIPVGDDWGEVLGVLIVDCPEQSAQDSRRTNDSLLVMMKERLGFKFD
jgi:hypothetical protein